MTAPSVELQLARLVDEAPAGDDWLHELKYDGFRILIERRASRVGLYSRNGLDWTAKLPHLVDAVRKLPCKSCVLDGELVALDAKGNSSFGLLQRQMGTTPEKTVVFAFDLLRLDGRDVARLPLDDRKRALAGLLKNAGSALRPSSYIVGGGPRAFARACTQGLEGIISKRRAAAYLGGRNGDWLKVKCVASDEFVVIGYTAGQGARARLGAVLLAKPERDGVFRYVGRVGSGFTGALLDELLRRVKHRKQPVDLVQTPSRADLRGAQPVWVEPRIVVEVNHRGITNDGRLRQGSIKGMRPDKSTRDLRSSDRDVDRKSARSRRRASQT